MAEVSTQHTAAGAAGERKTNETSIHAGDGTIGINIRHLGRTRDVLSGERKHMPRFRHYVHARSFCPEDGVEIAELELRTRFSRALAE